MYQAMLARVSAACRSLICCSLATLCSGVSAACLSSCWSLICCSLATLCSSVSAAWLCSVISWLHCLHSYDCEHTISPGNASRHVLHLDTSKLFSAVWNLCILVWTGSWSRSGVVVCRNHCCWRLSLSICNQTCFSLSVSKARWVHMHCSRASLCCSDSAASLSCWRLFICSSLASLCCDDSAASLSCWCLE